MKLSFLDRLLSRCALGLFMVASLALVRGALAAESTCGITGAPRVVAVGDVHGSYDQLVSVLTMAGLLDRSAHWAGGRGVLIQVGDILDRGVETRPVLDLLMRLEKEAPPAGGRIIVLLGNHDVMNILGDLSAVQPAEYEAWKEPDSPASRTPSGKTRRMEFVDAATDRAREEAKATGQAFDEVASRQKILDQTPPGFVERAYALSASGEYGQWLRGRDVVATVNGVAFVHGGLTPKVAALGCDEINRKVRSELGTDLAQTKANPRAALATAENGPLSYRGLAQEDETAYLPSVEKVLKSMGVTAVVIGHTPTGDGKIRPRFGGRVVMVDVGMLASLGGNLAALELRPGGSLTAIYPTGRQAIERKAADPKKPRGPRVGRAASFGQATAHRSLRGSPDSTRRRHRSSARSWPSAS
jgi:Calcineurin-like phosphoesterase